MSTRGLADLVLELDCPREDIVVLIERRWVLPLQQDGDYIFSEADTARVQMILELRRDCAINDEAMEVVLGLLDKLYGVRRQMRDLLEAVAELPEAQRDLLLKRVGGGGKSPSEDR
jgi:chaperone modulatory protein CbpM